MNQALFSRINLALWLLMAVVTTAGYVMIPAGMLLPAHWGPSGEADAFLARDVSLLMMPVALLLVTLLFWGIGRFAPAQQLEASRSAWRTVVPSLSALFLTIQASIVLIGLGYPDATVRLICGALGLMLILMGNIMPKMQPNGLAGIRLPWLREPTVWRKTQRLGGLLFLGGGLVLLLATLLLPEPMYLLGTLAIALLVPLVVTSVYSYRLAHGPR